MDSEQKQRKEQGAESATGDWSGDTGGGGDNGEGCLGCLMWPLRAAWTVIKGVVGLIVKIGDAFEGGDGD